MLARCYQPSHPAHAHYQKRGITVCDRWRGLNGFQNFMEDMGEPPKGLTIERINNTLGYSPDNCKWATWKEQAANRVGAGKAIDPNSLRQRALAAGLPYMVVYLRIHQCGWDIDRALSTPKYQRGIYPR